MHRNARGETASWLSARGLLALAIAAASIALPLVGGCSGNKDGVGGGSGVSGVRDSTKEQIAVDRSDSKFDSVKEPKLTAETHFAAGQLADVQGSFDRAIVQYQAALKLRPNFPEALFRLGIDYMHLKQNPQAIATWKQYIKATNESANGYSNLGLAQQLAGDTAGAEESYRKGIERDPKNQHCRVNYGVMLAMQNRTSEATLQFQAVLTPAEVHYNLGSVYEQQGKLDEARAEYSEALKLDPKMRDAESRLASLK
jgi:tetratricopeptide (TPR) repeat protein